MSTWAEDREARADAYLDGQVADWQAQQWEDDPAAGDRLADREDQQRQQAAP